MKKLLGMTAVLLIVLSLAGCKSDPIQEDLIRYINEELPAISQMENDVYVAYARVAGENYTDDETMYYVIMNDVIPASDALVKAAKSISPETEEVRNVHAIYINAVTLQHEAFIIVQSALETQNLDLVAEANGKFDSAKKEMDKYLADLEKLTGEHKVKLTD